ncbi:hypothetical protein MPSEU_000369200 [Mayamaea pseudoterrestris]|nr:hypothetical protein MPSEU_000369200 [Mayamaea pseudoterrestris]
MNDFVHRDGFPALRLSKKENKNDEDNDANDETPETSVWNTHDDEAIPRHAFWACPDALQVKTIDKLRQDCRTVFTARAKDDGQAYSAGITYFCPSLMPPRCALEALALDIFRMHTQHLADDVMVPEQSGAEWWTLVMDDDKDEHDDKKKENDSDDVPSNDEDDESDEVGLHFDADYGLEEQASGLLLHPRLATVTYLSDYGAPTVVFDKRSPTVKDVNKSSLQGDITKGWLSSPSVGKHIAFDGRLLHGAPATFFPGATLDGNVMASEDGPPIKKQKMDRVRYTFLVNIWINHCPLDAEPLEDSIVEQLTPVHVANKPLYIWKSNLPAALENSYACTNVKLNKHGNDEEPAGEEEFVLCDRLLTVKYNSTMEDLHKVATIARSNDGTVELIIAPDVVTLKNLYE